MAGNHFGTIFRITTWGESHGKAVGVVIDGCPAGLELAEKDIEVELAKRAPGRHPHTSPRKEPDHVQIYSGLFKGKTTGTPISILILNRDVDSTPYEMTSHLLRPGHANYTYLEKYGIFDYRGGGRASARETACRVAAGAIAKKFLKQFKIVPFAFLKEIGGESEPSKIEKVLEKMKASGDSIGGVVEVEVPHLPVGLGEPIYQKIEAMLAQAMLSIPAAKGFEMGEGFRSTRMKGSEHNDAFIHEEGKIRTLTNHAGGTLGGLTNGMPIVFRVAFKPTSSIQKPQKKVTLEGEPAVYALSKNSRHDPCVAIRAVPVVEAMAALVLADALLLDQASRVF
ncbi:MAG: chorismate synthase [Chlamydiales bacterium]